MNLFVPKDHLSTMDGLKVDITDEDIDDAVGDIRFEKGVGRHIELYGRYKGTVQTHEECVAFVKGVETVLNYGSSGSRVGVLGNFRGLEACM